MGKTKGCEKAPVEVLKALKEEIYTSEKGKIIDFMRLNLEEIHVDLNNLEEANYLILENAEEAFHKNDKVFFIGGDHNISYSIGKAFQKVHNGLIVVFDSHGDCMEAGKEPTHEEWLRKLIEEGFDPKNIVLIGTRTLHQDEIEFIKENNILVIKIELLQEDLQGVCDLIMERARNSNGFYISIDIDAVDPAFAPGTGYQEPGGMSSRELIYFVQRLALLKNFKGADIVEINPDLDINNRTVKLGAKLLVEMI